jgi:hypothetical protein
MAERPEFTPLQAQRVNEAFRKADVDFLFIGKSGAILLGYPSTTQDVDVFVAKSKTNARNIIVALRSLGFVVSREIAAALRSGRDFVQIKSGPFDLDIIHAPDGIESFEGAKGRSIEHRGYPVASLRDIIASKCASNRTKDRVDLELLEEFRKEFERRHSPPMRSAVEILLARSTSKHRGRKKD